MVIQKPFIRYGFSFLSKVWAILRLGMNATQQLYFRRLSFYLLVESLCPLWLGNISLADKGVVHKYGFDEREGYDFQPLISLILNYTPWGIRLDSIVISNHAHFNNSRLSNNGNYSKTIASKKESDEIHRKYKYSCE